MENDELIFVLNTAELKDGGYEGSFNDLASELEDANAVVSGDYDEDGTPIMTVYGIETEKMNDMLAAHGVESPEQYTAEVDSADNFDFDEETEGGEDFSAEDDTDTIEIVDDDDDEVVEIDDEIIEESLNLRRRMFHNHMGKRQNRPSMRHRQNNVNESVHKERVVKNEKPKGTQNLSESVTHKILNQIKDSAMYKRIMESVKWNAKIEQDCEDYTAPIPYSGIKVNGKEIVFESVDELEKMLAETKKNYKRYYKGYKSLNESETDKTAKFVTVLKKQHKLISILENVIAFKSGKLFEEEDMMAGADQSVQGTEDVQNNTEPNELGDQTATLTAIVFKVKNADDFIKTLVDNGIPEEALEKSGETDDTSGSDGGAEQQQGQEDPMAGGAAPMAGGMDAGMGGAAPAGGGMGGGNPFESLTTRLTSRLNEEDENPFTEPDQPAEDSGTDPLSTESNDNAESGEEVRLVDTSYASKVEKILQDVYGYDKAKFEDKIGGQIEETQDDSEPTDGSDGIDDFTGEENDEEKDGTEEEIKPEDIFGDL